MAMEVQIEGTPKTLHKRDRPRLHLSPWDTAGDRFVDIILSDGGADDGMDLRRQLLGRSHPVAHGEGTPLNWRPCADAVAGNRHRDDPLARGYPRDDLHKASKRYATCSSTSPAGFRFPAFPSRAWRLEKLQVTGRR
jgi:hypothetical protein